MARISVEKYSDSEKAPLSLLEQAQAVAKSVRQRAYEISRARDFSGSDIEDWLQAERDVTWAPSTDIVENDDEFQVRIALPGLKPKDIQVSAMPEALIVSAETAHQHAEKKDAVCFCEFAEKKLFRRLDLPAPIEVERVTASLDKGVLQLSAPKSHRKTASASAGYGEGR